MVGISDSLIKLEQASLEYKSLLYKVRGMLDKVKNAGFDVECYFKIVNDLMSDIEKCAQNSFKYKIVDVKNENNNVQDCHINNAIVSNINGVNYSFDNYVYAISELKKVEKILLEYDVYFKAINTSYYIKSQLNKEMFSSNNINKQDGFDNNLLKEEIDNLVEKMKQSLIQIKNVNINHYENEKKILSEIYSASYELIKYEILVYGNSSLYEYIKSNDIDLYFINECIKNEINKLDLNDKKNNKITNKIYELNINGLEQSYFDIEIIKLLLVSNGSFAINNNISLKLNDIIKKVDESNKVIIKSRNELKKEKEMLDNRYHYRKGDIKDFFLKAVSVLGISSVLVGGIFGIYSGIKKVCTKDSCKRTITTYSDWNGLNISDDYIPLKKVSDFDGKIYLKEYGVWKDSTISSGNSDREIKTYDVSNFDFENIEDYVNYGLDNYGVNYTVETESVYGDVGQLYANSYIEVEKHDVDTSVVEKKLDSNDFTISLPVSYFGYLFFWVIFFLVSWNRYNFIWESFSELFSSFRSMLDSCKDYNEQLNSLNKLTLKAIQLIESNESLKLEFNKLYEENKYLLNEPEELVRRFNDVCSYFDTIKVKELNEKNVKKLTKEKA